MSPPLLDDRRSHPSNALMLAALRAIDGAAALLREAGHTLGTGARATPLREAIAKLSDEVEQIDETASDLPEIALLGCELIRLSEVIAERNPHCSPAAQGCARLAEAAAELALEALTEGYERNPVEEISRRARQLEAINESRLHVDAMVAPLVAEAPRVDVPRRTRSVPGISPSDFGSQSREGRRRGP